MLRETENLEDQGDILQYLVDTQGLDFNTGNFFGIFFFTEQKNSILGLMETLFVWRVSKYLLFFLT